ncbi:uncharacterized protein LOC133189259 [Saccostrea echinata]|uniref:uncharacterized protein LOC133189259 n=1 Tax=Saccostrea echinata TaxID=191078 RepID=UPI002A816272|nr:uncharacterized protein LOC133189259 [Saccostrea echinata]
MATANSPYSSEGTTNVNRVCRLLLGPCADQLRDVLRKEVPPLTFAPVAMKQKQNLTRLTPQQRDLILPHNGYYTGNYDEFDISLLYTLLRNICNITPHKNGWGNDPDLYDQSLSANIERIRIARNTTAHSAKLSLTNLEFTDIWNSVRGAVLEMDAILSNGNHFQKEVDVLRYISMDPVQEKYYRDQIAKQYADDQDTKKSIRILEKNLELNQRETASKINHLSVRWAKTYLWEIQLQGNKQQQQQQQPFFREKQGQEANVKQKIDQSLPAVETTRLDHCVSSYSSEDKFTENALFERPVDVNNLLNVPENFKGGKISEFYENWKCITSDKWILDTVLGYKIEFDTMPQQNRAKPEIRFSDEETQLVNEEILKLEKQNVYSTTNPTEDRNGSSRGSVDSTPIFESVLVPKVTETGGSSVLHHPKEERYINYADRCCTSSSSEQNEGTLEEKLSISSLRQKEFQNELKRDLQRHKSISIPENVRDQHRKILDSWKKGVFFETSSYGDMKDFFISHQIVAVVGPPGSGKTALIRHVALQLESEYQIVPISKPEEIINYGDLNRPQIFVIDDVLGVFTLERNLLSDLERHSKQIENVLNRNSKFLMSCRLAVYNEAKVLDVVFLEVDKILNLNEKNILTSEDQKGIFESHMNNAGISCEIDLKLLHREDVFMFPLLCQMFSSDESVRKYGKEFFTRPSECLQSEINKIQKRNKIQYLSIVLCMLNNNCLSEEMLSKSKMFQEVCRSCKIKENTENWEIIKELSHLIDTYITKDHERYTFIHDSIFEVVAYQYGQQYPDQILDHMNSNFIANKVVLDTKEDTCIDAKCIKLNKSQYDKLAKRLYVDVKAGKLHDVFLNKALRDRVFKQKFMDILKKVPYEDVKTVFLLPRKESFNNVVYDSQKESEKEIDETEGQRESERQNLLLGLKCIDQKKIYEIRALSFIVYYGHLDLLKYFIKLVGTCQTSDIIFGTTPEEQVKLLVLACFNGNLDMVKILVENIGKKNINLMPVGDVKPSHNKHRYITPVIAACLRKKHDVVKYLVDIGADLNPQKSFYPALWTPARTGDLRTVIDLLELGADCNRCNGREISPLYMASRFGHLEVVKKLIEHGADINKCDIKGWSSLHIASLYGHSLVLETLIRNGAECDRCDKNKVTPLHRASLEGHVPVVEILLKNDADINKCEIHGTSSLHLASLNGHLSVVQTLLLHGAECDRCDGENLTPLHFASFGGFVLVIEKLIEHGADVHKCNSNGRSSLHLAAQNGQLPVVEKLILHGAKCDQFDINESTPMHFASEEGHLPVVEKLIEQCADVNVCNIYGQSSLHLASKRGHLNIVETLVRHGAKCDQCDENKLTPLHKASFGGHGPVVEKIIESGADINKCDNNGSSPLLLAIWGGHLPVVEKLIEHGADTNTCYINGWTPLLLASWEGHVLIVDKLIEHGVDINKCYNNGWSPLLLSSWKGHFSVVERLIMHGADINNFYINGWSPLSLASWKGHLSVVEKLIEHGADINKCDVNSQSSKDSQTSVVETNVEVPSMGHVLCVEKLKENGTNINKCDNNGSLPLLLAIQECHLSVIEKLVEYGADVNKCNKNEWSPLLLSSWKGQYPVVEKLIIHGADINNCYINGWSPLSLASWKGHLSVVEKLIEHGADINKYDINGQLSLNLASKNGHFSVVETLMRHGAK